MAKILFVDDDDHFSEAMMVTLKDAAHDVLLAKNGRIAKDILGTQKFDLIISDVQMPYLTGLELLEWVKSNCDTKFLLMTGFSHLIETKQAHALGADDFLTKPFKVEELNSCLFRLLKRPDTTEAAENQQIEERPRFCKVPINEFVSRPIIDFDVYIKLSEKKYIKIGHAGCRTPTDQIEKYRQHGENFLYIPADSFTKLLSSNLEIAKVLKASPGVSQEKKLNFMKYTGQVLLEKVFQDKIDKEVFRDSSEYLKLSIDVVSENSDFIDLMNLMNTHSDKLYVQCVSTSIYAVMIAKKIGITSQQTFFKLSMASLFHEIGLKEVDSDIINKPRQLFTTNERKLYESHPLRGYEIMSALGYIPSEVMQLVHEHHEDQCGTGYPRGLKKSLQHPLSSILQLAALFSEIMLGKTKLTDKSGLGAIQYISSVYNDRVDTKALDALRSIFTK